jgi:tetratricopeptide (TPR) repeat protein
MAEDRNELERASRFYQQALEYFREADDLQGMMQIFSLLGIVEQKAGRLAEALVWHEKSHELAVELKNQVGLGLAAQNVGTVWQLEGEAARERGDEPTARRHFEEAYGSVMKGLHVWQALSDKPREADSWGQLADIYLCLGDLAAAEFHADEARQIEESLGLKKAWMSYNTLSEIAQARGDLAAADKWVRKRDDLIAELERRAGP